LYTETLTSLGSMPFSKSLYAISFSGRLSGQPLREIFEEEESTISGMSRLAAERSCLESVVRLEPTYGSLSTTSARSCRWELTCGNSDGHAPGASLRRTRAPYTTC